LSTLDHSFEPRWLVVALTLLVGCGSDELSPSGPGSTPLTTPLPTPDLSAEPQPAVCPQAPALSAEQTARLEVPIAIEVGKLPLELGATAPGADHSYYVTFLGLFLGNFQLLDADGVPHAATLLDGAGRPRVYDVQLVNAAEPDTQRILLAAPPGQYGALRFRVGVSDACNALDARTREWPLTIESEMAWGWTMLHLRLEGRRDGQGYMEHHLGFPAEYHAVQVPALIALSQAQTTRTLAFEIDRAIDNPAAPMAPVADNLARAGTFELR
jgi:hypothetical protein